MIHFPVHLSTSEAHKADKSPQAGAKVTVQVQCRGSEVFCWHRGENEAGGTATIEKDLNMQKKRKCAENSFATGRACGWRQGYQVERNVDIAGGSYCFVTNRCIANGWPTSVWDDRGLFRITNSTNTFQFPMGLANVILDY